MIKMSIKVYVKVTDEMKNHVKYHADKFYEEVVLNAELSPKQVYILFYLYRYRLPKDAWKIYYNLNKEISISYISDTLRKLYKLNLLGRKKINGEFRYFVEGDLPCRIAKNVEQPTC